MDKKTKDFVPQARPERAFSGAYKAAALESKITDILLRHHSCIVTSIKGKK
jgi:hypothetical protein